MSLPGSGAISLVDIQAEFGGANPVGLAEYYRGGAYTTANNSGVPTSGAISLNQFHGTIMYIPGSQNYTAPGTYYWTVPAYVTSIVASVYAGGGGGGASVAGGDTHCAANGGSGGYLASQTVSVTPGSTLTIVVGGGGAGGTSGAGYTGQAGGTSSVAGVSATGGYGGTGCNGDNAPSQSAPYSGGGSPNGVAGWNNASWMVNRNTNSPQLGGKGANGTGYGTGGVGGYNTPGTAGGAGRVYFSW